MSFYTAKYLRGLLEDLPDEEPVFGILSLRSEREVELVNEDGDHRERIPTPEEWVKIVDLAEKNAEPYGFNLLLEFLSDAEDELHPSFEEEDED